MRVELGEIETVLEGHGQVREAVVELAEEKGEGRLVAYVVATGGEELNARELRRHLRMKLPEHMVPARYVVVEELPQLPSGKVNRRGLAGVQGRVLTEQGIAGPRTETERELAEIWKELLKVEEVGVEQNFFELGGHSLLVLQVMARIRRRFDVELGVRRVFEEPTIAGLGVAVEEAKAQGMKARRPILRGRKEGEATTSREALLAQLDQLSPDDLQNLLQKVLDGKQPEDILRSQ
jgi:acyl carrier protein